MIVNRAKASIIRIGQNHCTVLTMLLDVFFVLTDQVFHVAQHEHRINGHCLIATRNGSFDGFTSERESIRAVQNHHVQRSGGCAFLLIAEDFEAVCGWSVEQQTLHSRGVSMEVNNDTPIRGEESVES